MDFETENRLAPLLVEGTRRLRLQADKEGVQPNSLLLAATARGVQQANQAMEVDEMWRATEEELEMESKMNCRTNGSTNLQYRKRKIKSRSSVSKIEQDGRTCATSSSERYSHSIPYSDSEDELWDDELEEFFHPRVKQGRGAVGSRMGEVGPYLSAPSDRPDNSPSSDVGVKGERERRVQSPEQPLCWGSKSPNDEPSTPEHSDEEETKNDRRGITYDCRSRRSRGSITYDCRSKRSRRGITYDCRVWRTMGD